MKKHKCVIQLCLDFGAILQYRHLDIVSFSPSSCIYVMVNTEVMSGTRMTSVNHGGTQQVSLRWPARELRQHLRYIDSTILFVVNVGNISIT